jgi:hypothetical protein
LWDRALRGRLFGCCPRNGRGGLIFHQEPQHHPTATNPQANAQNRVPQQTIALARRWERSTLHVFIIHRDFRTPIRASTIRKNMASVSLTQQSTRLASITQAPTTETTVHSPQQAKKNVIFLRSKARSSTLLLSPLYQWDSSIECFRSTRSLHPV